MFFIFVFVLKVAMSMVSFMTTESDSPCVPGRSCGLLATALFFYLQKEEKVVIAVLSY